jgi:hypothetical protein
MKMILRLTRPGSRKKQKKPGSVDITSLESYNKSQSFTVKATKDRSKQFAFPREPGQLKTGKASC